jgi:eukaryotic-like serine/threonine-protein kinase
VAESTIRLNHAEWTFNEERPLGPPGGFGAVFVGEGPRGPVAVKRLHVTADDMAHRELRIAQELMSRELQWVIPVFDAGQDADSDRYFIIMALAEASLSDYLQESPTDQVGATNIILSVARGLQEVGDLVHRDLKPGNILRHQGRWKLSDFGIARFVEDSTSTRTLKAFLSPQYAAPEQWLDEHATNATDVYALGCVAHAVFAGRPPFEGPDAASLREQHLSASPPPLTEAPAAIRGLTSMMLRKSPEARPSIGRVIARLESDERSELKEAESTLADVGARLAEAEATEEARQRLAERAAQAREALANDAWVGLKQTMSELFASIKKHAPTARISNDTIQLGRGLLRWRVLHRIIPPRVFAQSGWDVVAGAILSLQQSAPAGGALLTYSGRSANLWYARVSDSDDYRWIEVPYMTIFGAGPSDQPYAMTDLADADIAGSNVIASVQLAAEPVPIDDENQNDFFARWQARFALAAEGRLARPSSLPE